MTLTRDPDAPASTLRARLGAFGGRLRSLNRQAATKQPTFARQVAELVEEFELLTRDILHVRSILPAGLGGDEAPVAPTQRPASPAAAAADRARPAAVSAPAEPEQRLLPDPCTKCGGPVYRRVGVPGRNPQACDSCRKPRPQPVKVAAQHKTEAYRNAHPEPGMRRCSRCEETKPEADFNIKNPATGNVDSLCRPCRAAYSAERYVRVGSKVVTVELREGDAAVGRPCPRCTRPFEVGQHVQGDDVHHEVCG